MNSHHACILLALVLLLSNSALTYPSLPYAYPQKITPVQMMMEVPAKRDTLWSQYEVPSMKYNSL
ncbi:hypothetical protein I4U23_008797 [Adineta vaga]|nr:hypothetical protein I4U23_008797 [Adineta vaga]